MKKLTVTIIAVSALISCAQAMQTNVIDEVAYTNRYIENIRRFVTSTNAVRSDLYWFSLPKPIISNDVALAEVDSLLTQRPILALLKYNRHVYRKHLPRAFAASIEAFRSTKPNIVKAAELGDRARSELTPEEWAAHTIEGAAFHAERNVKDFKKRLGGNLSRLIVPTLRRNGKAITTGPDGVSPVKAYADRISAALNAPQMEGLNDILDELGVPARIDVRSLLVPSVEDATALADKILRGYEEARTVTLAKLEVALGTDAYNTFLERYNGGTR